MLVKKRVMVQLRVCLAKESVTAVRVEHSVNRFPLLRGNTFAAGHDRH